MLDIEEKKKRRLETCKKYRENNREKIREQAKQCRDKHENKLKKKERDRKYRLNNLEKINDKRRERPRTEREYIYNKLYKGGLRGNVIKEELARLGFTVNE